MPTKDKEKSDVPAPRLAGASFSLAKSGWCACCGDAVRVLGGGEDSKVREDVVSFEAVEMALDKEVLRGAFAGDRKSPFSPQRNRLGVK
ncbi:hypothetical protein VTI28DRAFT_1399 [Corynascus sepedonium]